MGVMEPVRISEPALVLGPLVHTHCYGYIKLVTYLRAVRIRLMPLRPS